VVEENQRSDDPRARRYRPIERVLDKGEGPIITHWLSQLSLRVAACPINYGPSRYKVLLVDIPGNGFLNEDQLITIPEPG
jgi:hypothetical protein